MEKGVTAFLPFQRARSFLPSFTAGRIPHFAVCLLLVVLIDQYYSLLFTLMSSITKNFQYFLRLISQYSQNWSTCPHSFLYPISSLQPNNPTYSSKKTPPFLYWLYHLRFLRSFVLGCKKYPPDHAYLIVLLQKWAALRTNTYLGDIFCSALLGYLVGQLFISLLPILCCISFRICLLRTDHLDCWIEKSEKNGEMTASPIFFSNVFLASVKALHSEDLSLQYPIRSTAFFCFALPSRS